MKPNFFKKTSIGRVEKVALPSYGVKNVHAKIDTGADLSSIWASDINEKDGVLSFKLFDKKSPHYTGEAVSIQKPHYLLTRITNSFGQQELRYVVKLRVKVGGKTVRGTFTLSDRSKMTYPMLIGRKLLNRRFVVDVSKGSPLKDLEDEKKTKLQKDMDKLKDWEKTS